MLFPPTITGDVTGYNAMPPGMLLSGAIQYFVYETVFCGNEQIVCGVIASVMLTVTLRTE